VACVVAYLASFCARAGCGTTDLRFSEESLNEIFSQTSRYISSYWESATSAFLAPSTAVICSGERTARDSIDNTTHSL